MSNAQIEKRALRILSKASALGFTKNGSQMVIDQAREIVAAEEGFRNWHALRAVMQAAEPGPTDGLRDASWAVRAIVARIQGVFDDPALVAFGPLGSVHGDILAIASLGLSGSGQPARMLAALETASRALDQTADGAEFDRVVEQTGVTNEVPSTISEARAAVVVSAAAQTEANDANAQRAQWASSSGHSVDMDEVAEWVGIHHQVNFDTAGERRQEWIDRFVAAHADDERFATYLVCNSWGHIFIGSSESETRWVYRLGSDQEGVIFAQIRGEGVRWTKLDRAAMADLTESINDNGVPENYAADWADEVELALDLPNWAAWWKLIFESRQSGWIDEVKPNTAHDGGPFL